MRRYRLSVIVLAGMLAACAAPTAAGAPQPWAWEMPQCVAYDHADYAAPRHRVGAEAQESRVREVYEQGWGARAMADLRGVVAACASYEHGDRDGPGGFREQHTVQERGFAGDESLVVRTVRITPPVRARTWYAAVVRHGDTVVTVRAETRADAVCGAAPAVCAGGGG